MAACAGGIERAQVGKQIGRGFDQIAARRQVEHQRGVLRHPRRRPDRRPAAPRRPAHFARRAAAALAARNGRRACRARSGAASPRAGPAAGGGSASGTRRSISARGSAPGRSSTGRIEAGDDGRFEPHRRRPAVDDQVDAPAQVGEHMLRGGRRDMSGAVGRRRHHRLGRKRPGCRARPDGSAPARQWCRGRRWQARRPGNPGAWAAPASAAPARTPRRAVRRPGRSARASAPRPCRRHGR